MTIILEGRPISPYPFGFFISHWGLPYAQSSNSKKIYHLVSFPRGCKYSFSNELLFSIIELIKSVLNAQKRFMLVENESTSLPLSYWQNRGSCF
jgi:hypothetical protein